KRRNDVSASGATSVATTSSPLARNCAAQLAPITPVPMIATFWIGLLLVISVLLSQCFDVCDAGEISLGGEKRSLVGPVEFRRIERTGEIGHEHAVARNIQSDADTFHQVRDHDLRLVLPGLRVNGRAVHRVATWGIAAVGPVQEAILKIEFEIDRLGKAVEEDFDVAAVGRRLTLRDLDPSAQDASRSGVVLAFLRPIDLSPFGIDGDPNAPSGLVVAVVFARSSLDEGFDLRTVEIRAHDS